MRKGSKMSEESRLKMSLAKKGKPSNRRGYISPNKGVPMSEEQKKKIGDANRGRKMKEEVRLRMIASKTGKSNGKKGKKYGPLSEEHKRKLSEITKKNGNIPPNLKGRKRNPEECHKATPTYLGNSKKKQTITDVVNIREFHDYQIPAGGIGV